MRKWELIKQSKPLKILKSKILSNLFNEKYGLKLGEFNNTVQLRLKELTSKQQNKSSVGGKDSNVKFLVLLLLLAEKQLSA